VPDRAALAFQAEAAVLRASGAGAVSASAVAATWTRVFAHCGSTSQLRSSPVYASALRVAVACVVVDPSVGADVYELISRHVAALHNQAASKSAPLSPSSSNAVLPAEAAAAAAAAAAVATAVPYADLFERNAVALAQAAAALAPLIASTKAAARKLTALINALVDDLLAPSLSGRVRSECGAALTELLASCPSYAEKSVRHMVDEFFVQHDRYRDALSRDEQQRVLCEELISPFVATLSRIAARLNDAAITRTMVQPLISRVELSFLPVDVLLLDHLMQLATLGHEDSHDEIVDLLIDVFVKIVDSKPPKKMPNTIANAFMTLAKKLNGTAYRDRLLRRLLRLHQLLMQRVPRVSTDASAVTSVHLAASGRLLAPIAELMPDMRAVGALREYAVRVVRAATPPNGTAAGAGAVVATTAAAVASSEVDDAVHRSADELAHLLRSMWFSLVLWSQVRDTSGGAVASPAPVAAAGAQQQQQQQANSRFSDSWLPTMASIACRMPSLAPGSQRVWLGMQAEVSTCLKHGFQKREAVARLALQTLLPSQASALRTMAPELCAYVLAVHTLEVRRIGRSLTASAALQYVADDALEAAALVAPLRTVADELANTFRNFMKQLGARPARDKALAEATQALLIGLCHSSAAVRAAAAQHVDDLTRVYPHVLWNTSCLTTLLDLLDIVGKSVTTTNYVSFSVLPNSAVGVDLPEDSAGKRQLLTSMVVLATSWLKDALHRAPGETQALLHQYMHHFRRHSAAFLHHVGYSLAVDIATRAQIGKAKVAVDDRPPCTVDNGSTFVNALELKALYTGEIDGMMKLLQQFGDDAGADVADALEGEPELCAPAADDAGDGAGAAASAPAGDGAESGDAPPAIVAAATLDTDGDAPPTALSAAAAAASTAAALDNDDADAMAMLLPVNEERDVVMRRMAMVLLAKYRTFLSKFADGGLASASDVEAFSATLYRTAAFLIARRSWSDMTQELIHLLAWAPVLPFTRASMRAGVFAWGWLMAARPDCSFGAAERDARRVVLGDRAAARPVRRQRRVGRREHSRRAAARRRRRQRAGRQAAQRRRRRRRRRDCARAARGGGERAAAGRGERGGVVCRRRAAPHLARVSRRAAHGWFQSSATHVATLRRMADRAVADPALLTIVAVESGGALPAAALVRALRRRGRVHGDADVAAAARAHLPRGARLVRRPADVARGREPRRGRAALNTMVQFADVLERDHLFEAAGRAARRSHMLAADVSHDAVEQLSDMRNLIVLLLGHEMERAVAWNNPLSRPDKAFTKDVERFAVRHRRATARDWRVHVRAAWRASVHVAVRLGDRFRHSAAVREALAARIVQSGAARLAGDGDAVTAALLAVLEHGASSRKEDVVEQTLTALSRWAPTSPTAALRLLRTDFRSDSRVIDYALRSLRRCSVRAVIFLIPQLVQALRYDRTGLVEQFLRAAGRASELVAHQIIWNARIYTIKDDAGNTDGDLAPVAQRLSDAVVAQF
jgi:hypothetical protein